MSFAPTNSQVVCVALSRSNTNVSFRSRTSSTGSASRFASPFGCGMGISGITAGSRGKGLFSSNRGNSVSSASRSNSISPSSRKNSFSSGSSAASSNASLGSGASGRVSSRVAAKDPLDILDRGVPVKFIIKTGGYTYECTLQERKTFEANKAIGRV